MKQVIIFRGVAGAGKSTLAVLMQRLGGPTMVEIVSADKYFERMGGFDGRRLAEAHGECMRDFHSALNRQVPVVIVDNTNTAPSEFAAYAELGESSGYLVSTLVVEKRHNRSSIHNVPPETVARQRVRLMESIRP